MVAGNTETGSKSKEKNMNAEQLQEHENRGHALASAWLALGVQPHGVRLSVATLVADSFGSPLKRLGHWPTAKAQQENARRHTDVDSQMFCATMAGCELAIEQWEAKR
jgi:hypothetical protein